MAAVEAEKEKKVEKRENNIAEYKSRLQLKPKILGLHGNHNNNSNNSHSHINSSSSNSNSSKPRMRAGFEGKKEGLLNAKP